MAIPALLKHPIKGFNAAAGSRAGRAPEGVVRGNLAQGLREARRRGDSKAEREIREALAEMDE